MVFTFYFMKRAQNNPERDLKGFKNVFFISGQLEHHKRPYLLSAIFKCNIILGDLG